MKLTLCANCKAWERFAELDPKFSEKTRVDHRKHGFCRALLPRHEEDNHASWPVSQEDDGCCQGEEREGGE